jgi:leucyl aminopeptidase (aminopeptidase T)
MEAKLQEYARLLIEVGLNVQKGQDLVISSPVECASFARMCAKAAYAAGSQVFRLPYDLLAPHLGDYGRAVLGLE